MKKIILLAISLLALAACAPQPQRERAAFVQTCIICMLKAQIAEANLKACPKQVRLKDERSELSYKVFKALSESIFKEAHTMSVQKDVERIKREKSCDKTVERIQSGNAMYEFLAVK
jgi:hypothetical protein